jgi:hypothetical protein
MVKVLGLLKLWAARLFARLPFKDWIWTRWRKCGAILAAIGIGWRLMLAIKDNYDFAKFAFHEIGILLDAIPSLPHVPSFRPLLLEVEWLLLSPLGPLVVVGLGVLLVFFGGPERIQTVVQVAPTSGPPLLPPRRRNMPSRALYARAAAENEKKNKLKRLVDEQSLSLKTPLTTEHCGADSVLLILYAFKQFRNENSVEAYSLVAPLRLSGFPGKPVFALADPYLGTLVEQGGPRLREYALTSDGIKRAEELLKTLTP